MLVLIGGVMIVLVLVGAVIVVLVLKREVKSQSVIIWLHCNALRPWYNERTTGRVKVKWCMRIERSDPDQVTRLWILVTNFLRRDCTMTHAFK